MQLAVKEVEVDQRAHDERFFLPDDVPTLDHELTVPQILDRIEWLHANIGCWLYWCDGFYPSSLSAVKNPMYEKAFGCRRNFPGTWVRLIPLSSPPFLAARGSQP